MQKQTEAREASWEMFRVVRLFISEGHPCTTYTVIPNGDYQKAHNAFIAEKQNKGDYLNIGLYGYREGRCETIKIEWRKGWE